MQVRCKWGLCWVGPTVYLIDFMERETGIEPVTSSLGSWRSTAELLPLATALDYHPALLKGNVTRDPKAPLPAGRGGRRSSRHDESDTQAADGAG